MNMNFERKLAIPMEVKEMYPLTGDMAKIVDTRAQEIKNILSGKSNKLMLVIGPCSADNEDSVIDYISRLAKVQEQVKDQIFIIPRIYTNKPRTTGDGYKGMLHQPDPTEKPDMFKVKKAEALFQLRVCSRGMRA
ncbi:MAG: 3-deoxy-7-phosphoheptulonate synthase, partial [Clostridia bacterium]|nr:3-deoxy-7-phosphoheptulonate synthase [Clostridia bacterium]